MSELINVKGIILSHMEAPAPLKSAVLDVLNAIDNDLDEQGYECSSDVDTAIEALDKVLADVAEEEEAEDSVEVEEVVESTDEDIPNDEEDNPPEDEAEIIEEDIEDAADDAITN